MFETAVKHPIKVVLVLFFKFFWFSIESFDSKSARSTLPLSVSPIVIIWAPDSRLKHIRLFDCQFFNQFCFCFALSRRGIGILALEDLTLYSWKHATTNSNLFKTIYCNSFNKPLKNCRPQLYSLQFVTRAVSLNGALEDWRKWRRSFSRFRR